MIPVSKPASGDLLTGDWFRSIADAIAELQNKAIQRAEYPLSIGAGGTISSAATSGTFLCRITAVSGSFPVFTYTVQRVVGYDSSLTGPARWVTDGVDLTALNRGEAPGTAPYTYPSGVLITASDGTVNSTACKIKSIAVGAVVDLVMEWDTHTSAVAYSFEEMNSAY